MKESLDLYEYRVTTKKYDFHAFTKKEKFPKEVIQAWFGISVGRTKIYFFTNHPVVLCARYPRREPWSKE